MRKGSERARRVFNDTTYDDGIIMAKPAAGKRRSPGALGFRNRRTMDAKWSVNSQIISAYGSIRRFNDD
jgi:hypothetical protein